ncbi:MAG: helix-turn-helix domain-containing protein [Phaeodactylibacter sp.]|nr:helix-turn-helix domain-containing protein [Phaeodactylibacter sp.]
MDIELTTLKNLGKLLTADEVADILRISREGVYQRVKRRQIAYVKFHGRLYFPEKSLLAEMKVFEIETAAA